VTAWDRRARRARFLADSFASAREILTFYAGLAEWQGRVAPQVTSFSSAVAAIPPLLKYLKMYSPYALAQAARGEADDEADERRHSDREWDR